MTGNWTRRAGLALLLGTLLAGCGGSSTDASELTVRLTPNHVSVRLGESVQIVVDMDGLGAGDTLAGYTIDLPEAVANIDIDTAPCPAGSGSPGCQVWTVRPGANALPGEYAVQVSAAIPGTDVWAGRLLMDVRPALGATTPAAVRLTADWPVNLIYQDASGGLWGAGVNGTAQLRRGYETDNTGSNQPRDATTPIQVWPTLALANPLIQSWSSAAVTPEGTVWRWGGVSGAAFVPGLTGIADLRGDILHLAARDTAGRLWAPWLGGQQEAVQTANLPIVDWYAVEANSEQRGLFALLLDGGHVAWLQPPGVLGGTPRLHSLPALDGAVQLAVARCTAQDVPDLLVAGRSDCAHALVLMGDGRVLAVGANDSGQLGTGDTVARPCRADGCTPFVVPLPQPAVAVAAGTGRSFALLADGSLWAWSDWGSGGASRTPVAVDTSALPAGTMLRTLAPGAVIDDCRGAAGGRVWVIDASDPAPRLRWLEPSGCPLDTAEVRVSASSGGRVGIEPLGLQCQGLCVEQVTVGTTVTLSILPDAGYRLASITGTAGCDALSFTVTGYRGCVVSFEPDSPAPTDATLSLEVTGSGRVILLPSEQECPLNCSVTGPVGSTLTLRALPAPGWELLAFGGDADCFDGQVTLSVDLQCTAVFIESDTPPGDRATLSVARGGGGAEAGIVRYEGSSTRCPDACSFTVTPGEPFRLLAESTDASVQFVRWEGCDAVEDVAPGTGNRCLVTLDMDRTVTAIFEPS